jgi:quercetin dioxygenase-like cupin family protein
MMSRSTGWIVLSLGLAVPSQAAAQDAVTSNPTVYHVVLENAAVRVLRVSVAPGQKTVPHEHPDNAVLVLANTKMKFTGADGQSQDAEMKANDAMWMPAAKHSGENIGSTPIDALIIELKGHNAPSATIPDSRPGASTTQLFDNPRARGVRATLQPSFHEDAGTSHDYDQVVVALAPSDISLTVNGKTKSSWKAGDAEFIGRGVKHESKAGQQAADVFILAIK